jgi:light-regulated signal transduction histidine kinase (bacteriophytochrome)
MSACSFVKHAVNDPNPLTTEESRSDAIGDVEVISNALNFVHDLLRNMLDIHRAANKDLVVDLRPTDLLRDVLEPVASMLRQRRSKVQFLLECPEDLYINTDHLRLKQIVLNLSRNSTKFVDEGFIRLRASVVDGLVEVSVEDSGPGIPAEKRDHLFSKFQKSLDSLSQGTVSEMICLTAQEGKSERRKHFSRVYVVIPGNTVFLNEYSFLNQGSRAALMQEPGGAPGRGACFGCRVR